MQEVFLLLVFCSFFAYLYSASCSTILCKSADGQVFEQRKCSNVSQVVFMVMLIVLVCFAGLRTTMNDTEGYLVLFDRIPDTLSGIGAADWTIGSNPLFFVYQVIIRSLISKSGYVFLFLTSCIVVTSYLTFIKRYSADFTFSIYILIAFTIYAFTMAAMKQVLATAIAIWAIPYSLEGKPIKAAFLIFVAMFIHPYVLVYLAIFFVSDDIWNKKMWMLVIMAFIGKFFYSMFLEASINLAAMLGDIQPVEYFEGQMNIFRLLFYMIAPVLSFVYRNSLRENKSRFSVLCINLSVISACFMLIATSGGANMFGRMANYFGIFQCFSLPIIFRDGIRDKKSNVLKFIVILCLLIFYFVHYSGYAVEWNSCVHDHLSLFKLIANW